LDAREVQRTLQSAAREAGESPRSSEPQAGDFHDLFDRTSRNPDAFDSEVPSRRARITWASQIEPEPVVWAWRDGEHGRIPAGSLSVAAGREGTGKSSFGMWKAAQITRGSLPGSYQGRPRNVLYVALEDSWKYTLVPRLMAAGADLGRVGRFDVVSIEEEEVTLSLPVDNRLLEDAVTGNDVALVVIDPLMSVIGERIDTHREREVRSALDPLAKIADRTDCVILGIAHFNKGNGTDAASLITGSGAFKNVPRSIFGFARDESDDAGGRVMSQVKNSLGRDDLPSLGYVIEPAGVQTPKGVAVTGKFTFTGETDRTVTEVLRESRHGADPEETSERDEAAEWLLGYLAEHDGEVPAGEAIKAAGTVGIAKRTLTRARKRAGVISAKDGMTGGWVWSRRGHEEAEEARNQKVAPSAPSVAPSHTNTCPKCLPDVPCIDHWKEQR
ncbi:MAG TPA: AAA family ATPase, partial [Beutenbergiaceae bacterium]|nr:AAA family ATPase [Beutenbergiaceae bacterium]